MKKRIIIASFIICAVILLVFLLIKILPLLFFLVFKPTEFFPTEGIWYCEEIQLYLGMGTNDSSTITVSGEQIECIATYYDGSEYLYVMSQDYNTRKFQLGEPVFTGQFISLTATELVLRDVNSQQTYVFIKQGTD